MSTRFIMTSSAVFLGATGILLTFFPAELADYYTYSGTNLLLFQLIGALLFSFAMINWMAKGSLIGGIYNKPIVTGNLAHFFIGATTLFKYAFQNPVEIGFWMITTVYLLFAILFSYLFFTNPVSAENK